MAATLTRVRDWPSRLGALIDERRAEPFAWGRHDCVSWARECVQAVTGVWLPLPTGTLTTPASAREAMRLVHRLGGLREAVSGVLGQPMLPGAARAGDLGLVSADDWILSVYWAGRWVAPGQHGLLWLRHERADFAWRVG